MQSIHGIGGRAARLALAVASATGLIMSTTALAAEWSDTEAHLLYGSRYREPFNPDNVSKTILTLQNASGFKYGRTFFFVDFLRSNDKDNNTGEVYGEFYPTFSLSKISGQKIAFGPVRDVGLTAGINYGAKNVGANPRVFLPGVTLDFDVPGFAFLNVDFLAYVDHGRFKPNAATSFDNCGGHETGWQITPAWLLPFEIGGQKFEFSGFWDFIGSRGTCKFETLTQPQLRWDVGANFGAPKTIYVGLEYQYWHNKFGFEGVNEHNPQALLVWKF